MASMKREPIMGVYNGSLMALPVGPPFEGVMGRCPPEAKCIYIING